METKTKSRNAAQRNDNPLIEYRQRVANLIKQGDVNDVACFFGINFSKTIDRRNDDFVRYTPVHDDWFNWFFSDWGSTKKVRQLLAHRGSHKTTILCYAIARHIILNPNIRIGLVRRSFDDASAIIQFIGKLLSSKYCKEFLSDVDSSVSMKGVWARDKDAMKIFALRNTVNETGTIEAMGVDKQLQGKHFDIIAFDDCVSIEDIESTVKRRKKTQVIFDAISNVLNEGGLALAIGTVWHRHDAYQLMSEAYEGNFEKRVFPIGTVLRYAKGELQKIKKQKTTELGVVQFSANYLLKHVDDAHKPFYNMKQAPFDDGVVKYAAIDPAFEGSNLTALSIGYHNDGKFFVWGRVWSQSITTVVDEIISEMKKHKVIECHIEENADQGAVLRNFQERDRASGIRYEGFRSTTKKSTRIEGNLRPVWENIFFADDCFDAKASMEVRLFVDGIRDWYIDNDDDDAIDSCARLLEVMVINASCAVTHRSITMGSLFGR